MHILVFYFLSELLGMQLWQVHWRLHLLYNKSKILIVHTEEKDVHAIVLLANLNALNTSEYNCYLEYMGQYPPN